MSIVEEAMEAAQRPAVGDASARPTVRLASRVILALDHFSAEERDALVRAVEAFARGEATARRLPEAEPLYLLRATPELWAVVRREAGQPLMVEDIATQARLDAMAHAG
jgi:hypothetical protein